jgi:hypothetical protein
LPTLPDADRAFSGRAGESSGDFVGIDQECGESFAFGGRRTGATGVYGSIHEDREDRRTPKAKLSARY